MCYTAYNPARKKRKEFSILKYKIPKIRNK